MKWSRFIFVTESDNSVILFNTYNLGIVQLDFSEYQDINKIISNYENKKFESTIDDTFKELVNMEFIIENNFDEEKTYLEKIKNEHENDDLLSVTLLTSTACNFSCSYCYENGINKNIFMTEDISDDILVYIEHNFINNERIKHLNIVLFGGEPTLNWKIVMYFFPKVKILTEKYNIKLTCDITTNGYLFDKDKLDFLLTYNLKGVQITLDGTEDIHNRRRCLKNNTGTFKKIICNMHNIEESIKSGYKLKINLRLNYDRENYINLIELLKYLATEFDISCINLSFGLITQTLNGSEANEHILQTKIYEEDIAEIYLKLYMEAKKNGFKIANYYAFDGYCLSKMKTSMIFNSDGVKCKCLSLVGRDNHEIDTQSDGSFFNEALYHYCFNNKCPFIPICHCGCRFESLVYNNDIYKIHCKRKNMESINSALMKISI